VAEEFLIQNFPDKDDKWIAHQLEYMNWGPWRTQGTVEFRWMNGGSDPLFPAHSDVLEIEHLLGLYKETREAWVAMHVGAVAMGVGMLHRQGIPVAGAVLPDKISWLLDYVQPRSKADSPYHIFGVVVRFHDHGPFNVFSEDKYGPLSREIEFPAFTNGTFNFMPDVIPFNSNPV